jgi:hypothetical protein
MPRTLRPRLGRYTPDFMGHHPENVNGTVSNFRKWRRRKMKISRASRQTNRA